MLTLPESKENIHFDQTYMATSSLDMMKADACFNAVVTTNVHALHLYKRLGFRQLGVITKGSLMKVGQYEDIVLHSIELK